MPIPYKWVSGTLVSGSDFNNVRLYRESSYIVFKENNIYYAYAQNSGSTDFSGSTCLTVVTNAFSNVTGSGGGILYFKRGTYTLTDAIYLYSGSIGIIGEERDSTILQLSAGDTAIDVIDIPYTFDNVAKSGIKIENITLDCNGNGGCLVGCNVNDSLFNNIRMKNSKNTLTMNLFCAGEGTPAAPYQYEYCRNNIISNCIFENCSYTGSDIADLCGGVNKDCIYTNNICRNANYKSGAGFTNRGSINAVYTNNVAYNVGNAFAFDGGQYVLIGNKGSGSIYGFIDWGYTPDSGVSKFVAHDSKLIGNDFSSEGYSAVLFKEDAASSAFNLGVPYNIIIEGNTIVGSGSTPYAALLIWTGSQDINISNNYIENKGSGKAITLGNDDVGWGQTLNANISGNKLVAPQEYAIFVNQPKSCTVKGNTIVSKYGISLACSGSENIVEGNNIYATAGVRVDSLNNTIVKGNIISGSTLGCILVQNSYGTPTNTTIEGNNLYALSGKTMELNTLGSVSSLRANISGNICVSPGDYAIYINQPKYCTVKGNTITGSYGIALACTGSGNIIEGNNIYASAGIRIDSVSDTIINGNLLSGSTAGGILIQESYTEPTNTIIVGNIISKTSGNALTDAGTNTLLYGNWTGSTT